MIGKADPARTVPVPTWVKRGGQLTKSAPRFHEPVWCGSWLSMPYSQALALSQSRLTRIGVIPRTSAVSSMLNPPK